MDSEALYSPCPCGSGKKFKFCCWPELRAELPREATLADAACKIRAKKEPAGFTDLDEKGRALYVRALDLLHEGLDKMRDGRFAEAIKIFRKGRKVWDFPTFDNNEAQCLFFQAKFKEAEEVIRQGLEKSPQRNPFALAILSDVLYFKGRLGDSHQTAMGAAALQPPSEDAVVKVCESLARFGEHQRILDYIRESSMGDAPSVCYYAGIAAANLNRPVEALRSLGRAAQDARYVEIGAQARARLEHSVSPGSVLGDWPYFTELNYPGFLVAKNILEGGRTADQMSCMDVLSDIAEIALNRNLLGSKEVLELLKECHTPKAERIVDALRRNPDFSEETNRAAEREYKKQYGKTGLGDRLRSARHLDRLVISNEVTTLSPLSPEANATYRRSIEIIGDAASTRKDLENAVRMLRELESAAPEKWVFETNRAAALEQLGRKDEAAAICEKVFAEHPEYVFGAANYLCNLVVSGRLDEAKAMEEKYRLPSPVHPLAYRAWTRVQVRLFAALHDEMRLENTEKALQMIEEQLEDFD